MCETKHGISLVMTLAQGDLILEALAEKPFKQVYQLIGRLHQQAAGADPERLTFVLTHAQLRLALEALGELPFNRVQRLLHSLHAQIAAWHDGARTGRGTEAQLSEH